MENSGLLVGIEGVGIEKKTGPGSDSDCDTDNAGLDFRR